MWRMLVAIWSRKLEAVQRFGYLPRLRKPCFRSVPYDILCADWLKRSDRASHIRPKASVVVWATRPLVMDWSRPTTLVFDDEKQMGTRNLYSFMMVAPVFYTLQHSSIIPSSDQPNSLDTVHG
jgi:hypothetical protein